MNSESNGPEMGTCVQCLIATRPLQLEKNKRRKVKDEVREVVETQICRTFYAKVGLLLLTFSLI